MSKYFRLLPVMILALVLIGLVGCQEEKKAEMEASAETHQEAAAAQVSTASTAAMEKLVLADAVDGKTDKVVTKCPGCSLGMDGSAEHALKVSDYEMHFCSATCKTHFEQNTVANLEALHVPEGG